MRDLLPQSFPFRMVAGTSLEARLDARCWGLYVSNYTAQWVEIPEANEFVPPNTRQVIALPGTLQAKANFGAPPGVAQPVAITLQAAILTYTERVVQPSGGVVGATALASQVTLERFTKGTKPAPGTTGRLVELTDYDRGIWLDNGTSFWSLGHEVLDAKARGALADGATDDTLALQGALNDLAATNGPAELYLPPGTYRVTAKLNFPFMQYKRVRGAAWGASIIRQDGNNMPILEVANEDTHSNVLEDIVLQYNVKQTTAQTASVGLSFTKVAGSGNGWYFWNVRRLTVIGAYIGIGITPGSGSLSVWGSLFESIKITNTSQTAIFHSSPTAIGMPVTTYRDIKILNAGGPVPASWAIITDSAELEFDQVDLEDWAGLGILVTGGNPVRCSRWHVERFTFTAQGWLFSVADGSLAVEDCALLGTVNHVGVTSYIFRVFNTGASLSAKRCRFTWTITAGTLQMFLSAVAAPTRGIFIEDMNDVNANLVVPSSSDATTRAAIGRNNLWALGVVSSARAFHSAAQATVSGVALTLALDSERWDTDTMHDLVVNNSRMTCRTAGLYLLTACVEFASAAGERGVWFLLNGATRIGGEVNIEAAAGANVTRAVITAMYQLGVGDYVELQVFQNSGAGVNVNSTAQISPEFSAARLGA